MRRRSRDLSTKGLEQRPCPYCRRTMYAIQSLGGDAFWFSCGGCGVGWKVREAGTDMSVWEGVVGGWRPLHEGLLLVVDTLKGGRSWLE